MVSADRYDKMEYRKCGQSGLYIPVFALGIWNNFGGVHSYENSREMMLTAFDLGINHIDCANNYGPPPGSAEEFMGRILHADLRGYRDELIISTKAGYEMWPGPYGNWGSKKSLVASLDQSLGRMKLDYVDIFYHHRRDMNTPLEETMDALAQIVRQGKALYIGLSNYNAEDTRAASRLLCGMGVKLLIHQPRYNMLCRIPEEGLFSVLEEEGVGSVAFCPLEQGILTSKYIHGIRPDSRAASQYSPYLNASDITPEVLAKVTALNDLALQRGQTLAQMALLWDIREGAATSVILGASRSEQIVENVRALENRTFTVDELDRIEVILAGNI